ncbi:MAG: hypothetical protein PHI97_29550 [Desulfobulbus sp.]|nr:hypothetical protein [Desulfobulbus sp.]
MRNIIIVTLPSVRLRVIGLLFVAATLIAGCTQPNSWTKPGISEADFDRDMHGCRRQASMSTQSSQVGDSGNLERSDMRDRLIRRCMEAKGYRLKE